MGQIPVSKGAVEMAESPDLAGALPGTDQETPAWERRFGYSYPIAVRQGLGAGDLTVLINQEAQGFSLSVWDGSSRTLRAIGYPSTTFNTTVTTDGRWVLDLLDPTGSEVGHLHATSTDGGGPQESLPVIRGARRPRHRCHGGCPARHPDDGKPARILRLATRSQSRARTPAFVPLGRRGLAGDRVRGRVAGGGGND